MCSLFGFLSTPTPDEISIIELLIAFLLIIFISPINIMNSIYLFSKKVKNNFYHFIIFLFLINLIFVGFFNGIYHRGNEFVDFLRDFIPILYLLIPFFLYSRVISFDENEKFEYIKLITFGLLIISIGYIYQYVNGEDFDIYSIGIRLIIGDSRDNIMQDPSITFSLVLTFCMAFYFANSKNYLFMILSSLIAFLILTCLFASVLRAPLGLFLIISGFIIIKKLLTNKKYFLICIIFSLLPILVIQNISLLEIFFELIVEKSLNVGLSGRDEELISLISAIETPFDLIFGFGLGAKLPNVFGYDEVRYAHNFFVYVLMKFGLFGLIPLIIIVLRSIRLFIYNMFFYSTLSPNFIIMISTVSPLTISLLFEPMYKSLSFGLIILLITIIGVKDEKKISK